MSRIFLFLGYIPPSSSGGSELSVGLNIALSLDPVLSQDDAQLTVALTSDQRTQLQRGIPEIIRNPYNVQLNGAYLKVDTMNNPDLLYYCGLVYVIVELEDRKTNPGMDPNLRNNVWFHRVTLECRGDILSLARFGFSTLSPQMSIYSGLNLWVNFEAELQYFGDTLPARNDERYNLLLRAYMSPDEELDLSYDSAVEIVYLPEEMTNQLQQYMSHGTTVHLNGPIMIHVPLSACTSQFLLLSVYGGVAVAEKDQILENNLRSLDVSGVVKCSTDYIDIWIKSFALPLGDILYPGVPFPFELLTSVTLSGEAGPIGTDGEPLFDFQFYLSHNESWDASDIALGFKGRDQRYNLSGSFRITTDITLDSEVELGVVPRDISRTHCGHVYLLVVMDTNMAWEEMSEYNNVWAKEVRVHCLNGKSNMSDNPRKKHLTYI